MPFTANRAFKARPRLIARAKDMHLLHRRRAGRCSTAPPACGAPMPATTAIRSSQAIQAQAATLDFAPTFQFGHPRALRAGEPDRGARARRSRPRVLLQLGLRGRRHRAEDRARLLERAAARAQRTRFIGRERGYHGVGFGGMAVGGIANNRKAFGAMLPGVDHLPHTYNREQQAFSKGEPEWGAHLADELERIVALHDDITIAAVIVEPMAGSTAVLPPPKGYLPAAARDLRQVRHPADLRRGHHRLRPARPRLRRRALRRRPGHDHLRQGRHLRQRADGWRDLPQGHPRRLHARAGARRRVLPRLHLFGASARLRGRPRRARPLPRRGPVRARQEDRAALVRRRDDAQGRAATCSTSAASASPPASTSPRGPTASASAATRRWSAASTTTASCSASSANSIAVTPPLIVSESQIGEIFDKVGKVIKAVA